MQGIGAVTTGADITMRRFALRALAVALSAIALSVVTVGVTTLPVVAEGNLASKGTALELNIDTKDLKFSQERFELETGKYYVLKVTSDGEEEIAVMAPELWRNSWINQIVVNDLETKVYGLYSIEFDDAGTFSISFVPVRPGEYDIYVPGFENRGLKGKVVVK
jgi:hypothetical protein